MRPHSTQSLHPTFLNLVFKNVKDCPLPHLALLSTASRRWKKGTGGGGQRAKQGRRLVSITLEMMIRMMTLPRHLAW